MRTMRQAWWLASAFGVASLMLSNGVLSADTSPVVHVKSSVKDGGVSLEAQADGPFEYTTYRPSANLFVLELSGVSTADDASARVISSDLVKGYRVQAYTAGNKPFVRVELLLGAGAEPKVERKDSQDLVLLVPRDNVISKSSSEGTSLVPVVAESVAQKTSASSFEIRRVSLAQSGEQTNVDIVGSGPLAYHASRLQNPDRLVLDFSDSRLVTTDNHIPSNLEPVREIRLAQFAPSVSRVVIDLRGPASF